MKQSLRFWARYKTTPHPDYGIVLYHRKTILSEWEKVYKGCVLFPELVQWMKEKGFKAVHWAECGNTSWGDCFFIRV